MYYNYYYYFMKYVIWYSKQYKTQHRNDTDSTLCQISNGLFNYQYKTGINNKFFSTGKNLTAQMCRWIPNIVKSTN